MSEKIIKHLIADTTAFINVVQLHEYAENIYTVPDVITEVKNKRQVRRLVVLPFDLQVREPNADCVKVVTEISKKTGDYASLSAIDMKVIALTYELEKEHVGSEHINLQPTISRVVASKEKPEEFVDNTKLVGFYAPKKGGTTDSESESNESSNESGEEDEEATNEITNNSTEKVEIEPSTENYEITEEELEKCFANLKCDPTSDDEEKCNILKPTKDEQDEPSEEEDENERLEDDNDLEDYDDDSGWITPSNIKKVKQDLEGKVQDDVIPMVACMSTDFAIQNVLKQMNLNISALNGRVIKHVRTYILRCYTCFKTTSVMSKMFCPKCGNKTLKKVAVSLDENGQQVIHINTKRPLTAKYKNQSLPRFKGGKHSHNPIIFEDQPMPRQMPSRVAKTKTEALDEDYTSGYSPFANRDINSRSALLRSKGHVRQYAKNTNYEEERRRRNCNRFIK